MEMIVTVPENEIVYDFDREYVIGIIASEMTMIELFGAWPYEDEKKRLKEELIDG